MTEITNLKEQLTLTQKLSLIAAQVGNVCQDLHLEFEKKHSIGYHNLTHISTATNAALLIVDTAIKQSNGDPLKLKEDLDKYNLANSTEFTLEDLKYIFHIVFSLHDTGNICQFDPSTGQIIFLDKYTAKNAEFRSQTIAKAIIETNPIFVSLNDTDKLSVLNLINYLIGHTIYQESDLDQPFVTFVKVCDQISIVLLTNQEDIIKQQQGLLKEIKDENPQTEISDLNSFFNFVHHRFPDLVADGQVRKKILGIWRANMPPYLTNPPNLT